MSAIIDIGLPDISEDIIEQLAEECESQVTEFIKGKIPSTHSLLLVLSTY